MDYSSVHLLNESLVLVSPEEVAQLEQQLGTKMPAGYQDFVTTLGLGILNDTVRVYTPNRISRELKDFQQRWDEYWFWDEGRDVLSKEKALESIIIADTGNGDELVFHPSQPDKLYVLPRDSGQIFEPGSTLDEAVEWILHSGVLLGDADEEDEDFLRPEGLYFEPFPPE
ncbi:MAG: SMI1/KNR4 family protein [Abitibacteriaceae bacterium]|nr:SMI1/KNR4 family protein [Abditibacteriaceae bacterium]